MPDNLADMLAKARRHYKRGERRKGAYYIEKILRQDFNHPGAWDLLHQYYGAGKSFEEFQPTFAKRYYPDKVYLLQPSQPNFVSTVAEDEKTSWPGKLLKAAWALFTGSTDNSENAPLEDVPIVRTGEEAASVEKQLADDIQPGSPAGHEKAPSPSFSSAPQGTSQPDRATPPQPRFRSTQGFTAEPKPEKIRVIVVDDIAQTRENIVRSLSFQTNIEVVGTATNGKGGIQLAVEKNPDVVLMDVNMPDMDGITATAGVRKAVPLAQIVILTVQDDVDYMRKAMMAGARDFLTKPPMIDELVNAVVRAGEIAQQEKAKAKSIATTGTTGTSLSRGKIITVYSPKGGAGVTTVASNLAAALYNEETQVVVVDGSLQFGDIGVFFNEYSKKTVVDLATRSNELDPDIVEDVLITHRSGIKLLVATRPELAEIVTGEQFAEMLRYLSKLFPYVIVDTPSRLTDTNLSAFEVSDIILLITTQDIPSIGSVRKFIDFARALEIPPKRIMLAMNQYDKRVNISPEKISKSFQHEMSAVLPLESHIVQPSINRGVPFMLQKDILARPIAQEMLALAVAVRKRVKELMDEEIAAGVK